MADCPMQWRTLKGWSDMPGLAPQTPAIVRSNEEHI